jgi:hypothetical protein
MSRSAERRDPKMNIEDFQLYLIGQMKAESRIESALKAMGKTRDEIGLAKKKMAAFGIEVPAHAADLYERLLGTPVDVEQLASSDEGGPFANSVALRFHLPLWPSFDFVVNRNVDGFAWGWKFSRTKNASPPMADSVLDLAPWGFVKEDFKGSGALEREDAWGHWESCWLWTPRLPGAQMSRYLLEFDFELLQKVHVTP